MFAQISWISSCPVIASSVLFKNDFIISYAMILSTFALFETTEVLQLPY